MDGGDECSPFGGKGRWTIANVFPPLEEQQNQGKRNNENKQKNKNKQGLKDSQQIQQHCWFSSPIIMYNKTNYIYGHREYLKRKKNLIMARPFPLTHKKGIV